MQHHVAIMVAVAHVAILVAVQDVIALRVEKNNVLVPVILVVIHPHV